MSQKQEKKEREKNAKKYLILAAYYISKGNRCKESAKRVTSEKKAEEHKKWAKGYHKKAKECIATTKKEQNMSYKEDKVYNILRRAVKKIKYGDNDAIENIVKRIIKASITLIK